MNLGNVRNWSEQQPRPGNIGAAARLVPFGITFLLARTCPGEPSARYISCIMMYNKRGDHGHQSPYSNQYSKYYSYGGPPCPATAPLPLIIRLVYARVWYHSWCLRYWLAFLRAGHYCRYFGKWQ